MDVETEITGKGILMIKVRGRMHLKDLQEMETRFKDLIKGHKSVIIDLSGLEVLFSMGLRALIMCAQLMELKGGKLVLMAPNSNVLSVLKASGTIKLIAVYADQERAEAAVLAQTKI